MLSPEGMAPEEGKNNNDVGQSGKNMKEEEVSQHLHLEQLSLDPGLPLSVPW